MLQTTHSQGKTSPRRELQEKHLDLWVDGSLYPIDPITEKHPPFSFVKDVLEFIGDGENGFLGYIRNVERSTGSTA